MDLLLDGADRLMSELRRRYPRATLGVTLAFWLPVVAFLIALTFTSGVWALVVLVSVPTLALAITVALRGLRRTWSWIWVLGTGTVLFLSGPAPQWWNAPDDWHATAIAVGAFVYANVYMGLLGSLDHFWIGRHGGTESTEDARFRLRRMLQVRALLATLIVVFGATGSKADTYPQFMPLDFLFGLCCLPIVLAAWVRFPALAWSAAGLIAVLALANLMLAGDEGGRRALAEYGWAQLVAIYLWIKAARVWYWSVRPEKQPPIRSEAGRAWLS